MAVMRRISPTIDARLAWRAWAVLVLALLAGLLAMHALAPGGKPAMGGHTAMPRTTSVEMAVPHIAGGHHSDGECLHTAAPGSDSHKGMSHADGTCAAGKVGSGYVPPAPTPGLIVPADDARHPGGALTASLHDRAPPDLAELQLLRI